ncbi:MAG: tetratricopeptide repeat protein [Candidatus Peribacteraceae bacterium]|nr:tetratricopeptide repeat protein [Candidatus Peribacteraceae bacterium]
MADIRAILRPTPLLCAALIALGVVAVYGASLRNGFVDWDDFEVVINNPLIRSFSPRIFSSFDPELYVPLTLFTFQIEYLFVGAQPFMYHVDALLLHIANAILVFWFLRMMIKNRGLALGGALLFAVHPVNVETVAWVSARKELLWAMFFLLTLIAYEKNADGDGRWKKWSVMFFVLALLSKPTALLAPFVLLLLDWRRGEKISVRSLRSTWPHFLLAYAAGVVALIGRGGGIEALGPWQALLLAFRSTTFYLEKLFIPLHLSPIYAAPEQITLGNPVILLSLLIVIALIASAWFLRRFDRTAVTGVGIFFLALLPTFLAYQKSGDVTLAADRYAYVPSVGFILVIVALLSHVRNRMAQRAIMVIGVVVACGLGFLAHAQSLVWTSTRTLFTHALREDPASHVALNNLASLALDEGDMDEAIRLSSEAVRLKPAYADAYVNLGAAYGRQKDYTRAAQALQMTITLNPEHPQAYFNLGGIEQIRGNLDQAAAMYRKAIELKPTHADAYFQLARVLLRQSKRDEARSAYQSAVELNPRLQGAEPELDAL